MFYDPKINKLIKIMSKYSIVVLRVNSSGDLVNSHPCKNCLNIIKLFKIKYVSYSNEEGNIVTKKSKELTTTHISKYNRKIKSKIITNF